MRFFALLLISLLKIMVSFSSSWAEVNALQAADTDQETTIATGKSVANSLSAQQTTQPAEQPNTNPYLASNLHSIHPIPEAHIMFRRRVWREISLKERKNRAFFSRGKEITKLIIEGVKEGALTPYMDDSLLVEMPIHQFWENLSLPKEESLSVEEKALGFTDATVWGEQKNPVSIAKEEEYFMPTEITILELMEDVLFDKVSSRLIYDIQSIALIIPANKFATGLRRVVATFKYKDLAAYFDSHPQEAVWVNVQNNAGNIKITEAFELRQFDGRIVKVENPDDANVDDIYNKTPQSGLMASEQIKEELIELEYFLWEN
jgi:gliding motility associated protien GldN